MSMIRHRRRRTLGGGLDITTFTQSLGAELLTNGDFAAWTADNPNGWTVSGESGSDPMVNEVGTGQGQGGAGTGCCNLYSSATPSTPNITQAVLTVGGWFEATILVDTVTAGGITFGDTGSGSIGGTYTTAGQKSSIGRAATTTIRVRAASALPEDITIDNVSVKRITFNTEQTFGPGGTIQFQFVLPVSPVTGETVRVLYRKVDDVNYWVAYLQRNAANSAWDFRLDSVSAGTATNRINATSVGTPNLIKVVASGDNHDCYTGTAGVDGAVTQRGSTINNATHNTATGLLTLYQSTFTPTRLKAG